MAPDDVQAVKWYALAAENGNPDAQRNLGTMYYLGNGVTRDIGLAYAWYYVASENGNANAEDARQALTAEMASSDSRVYEQNMKKYPLRKGILRRVMSHGSFGEDE